jgi:hypothetical protein
MRITFRCDPALIDVLPRPVPARDALPQWLKSMAPREPSEMHGRSIRTVKQCPPFVDAMSHGLPPLTVDQHPRSPLSFHVSAQLAGSPLADGARSALKFNSFWTIEVEAGWSLFCMHPANREDLPFRLLSGMVDADRFNDAGINFPALWTQPDFDGVLTKGTPVAQCFAVPRERPELSFEAFDAERIARYEKTVAEVLETPGVYRKRYRVKR